MKRGAGRRSDGDRPQKRSRGAKPSSAPADEELEELDGHLLDRMVDFLDGRGGVFDYGGFAAEFPGVKKKQLEAHFDFVPVNGTTSGRWEIRLIGEAGDGHMGDMREGRRCNGHIIFYDRAKGYGFVNSLDQPGDIFFPRTAMPKAVQEIHPDDARGQEVSFDLYIKDDGKPRADRIEFARGIPPPPQDDFPGGGVHGSHTDIGVGTIVRYEEVKGYGFIAPDNGGEDVFFLKCEMPPELAGFQRWEDIIDHRVEFEVHKADKGKFRAKRLVLIGRGRGNAPPPPQDHGAQVGSASRPGRLLRGRIARFDRNKGYGFITCPSAPEDVFFLPNTLPKDIIANESIIGLDVDLEMIFNEEGKPRANRIFLAGSSGGKAHTGTIIAFDPAKGFGFIKADDLSEDVFYLRSELPMQIREADRRDQVQDSRVEFDIKAMPDGKLRAQKIALLPRSGTGQPPPPPTHCGMPQQIPHQAMGMPSMPQWGHPTMPPGPIGRIRKFDKMKGYGFIESANNDDVFFLPSALPKEFADHRDKLEGLDVTFDMYINEDGKPRASKVIPLPMMPAGMPGFAMPYLVPPMGPMGPHMGPPMGTPMFASPMGQQMGPLGPMGPPVGPSVSPSMIPPMGTPMGQPMGQPMPSHDGDLQVGTICSFDPSKGFGFIAPDNIPEDVFFMRSELPPELIDQNKEKVIGQRVEFELKSMPDGKLRARNLIMCGKRIDGKGGRAPGVRPTLGKILRFDQTKGYGFISSPEVSSNVFFLRSQLPKELLETPAEKLKDLDVSFELYVNEEGKPRAHQLALVSKSSASNSRPRTGEVLVGTIVRYDMGKAYGFVKPDDVDEDVFFLRSEMPDLLHDASSKEEIERQRVEFEVLTMPDGKMRAQKMVLVGADTESGRGSGTDSREKDGLDDSLIAEMEEFLEQRGGRCDFGKFSSNFSRVKKRQLEQHFEISTNERGNFQIELPDGHPGKAVAGASKESLDPEPEQSLAEEERIADDARDDDDAEADEPAIPPGLGCQPRGVVREYCPQKGYGFIDVIGLGDDIFFPRSSLPEAFHGKRKDDLPELKGVEVSFELNTAGDRGPRAEKITLLLKWHEGDRCWLLARARP